MPADFVSGMFVREPAWHHMGVVLDEYPSRGVAYALSGQNFEVKERVVWRDTELLPVAGNAKGFKFDAEKNYRVGPDGVFEHRLIDAYKALVKAPTDPFDGLTDDEIRFVEYMATEFDQPILRPGDETDGLELHIPGKDYGVVENHVGWDIMDALVGEGIKYETAIVLQDGGQCSILGFLDEPYTVPGDNSEILPYVNVSWSHDGSGAVKVRPTEIRTVCWNTQSLAEMLGQRRGNEYTFRHTKNVMAHIEEAKGVMMGSIRADQIGVMEASAELAAIKGITHDQHKLFAAELVPTPPEYFTSKVVQNNVIKARNQIVDLFDESNPSIADEHKTTGWGMFCAGTEYLDHLRGARNSSTKFGRQLLRDEPLKKKLVKTINEIAVAA